MRDQLPDTSNTPTPTPDTNTTGPTIRRTYVDFPAPSSPRQSPSPRQRSDSSGSGSSSRPPLDSRTANAARPRGQRLVMSAEMRAKIQARAAQRGATAAMAGNILRATGGQGRGPDGRARGGEDPRFRRGRRTREDDEQEDDDGGSSDPEAQAKLAYEMQSLPPRQWLDYTPENLSVEDLRLDWPTIPTGPVGMVEGVTARLRWLSRRMQHGYDTPQELARRMQRGQMVHFENEQEKQDTLRLVKASAVKAAERRTEKKGRLHLPSRYGFQSLQPRDRARLADDLIRGVYPAVEAGATATGAVEGSGPGPGGPPPFLRDVVRTLANNGSYAVRDKKMLLGTIHRLLPARRKMAVGERV